MAQKYFIPPGYKITPVQEKRANTLPVHIARNWFAYGVPSWERLDPLLKPINIYSNFVIPKVSHQTMINAYEEDTEIMFGLDWITSVSVGVGHYFTAVNSSVQEHLANFAQDINLDSILINSGKEALGYGDSLWRYRDLYADPKSFDVIEQMPLSTLRGIWWDANNNMADSYEFGGVSSLKLKPAELIHFKWRTSNAYPFGLGLIAPLVKSVRYQYIRNDTVETRIRASYLDMKRSIEDTVPKALKRYIARNVFELTEGDPKQREDAEAQLANLDDEQDIVVDGPTKITELGARARVVDTETFTEFVNNPIIKAIGTPTARLFEKGALTEASAKSAKEVALMNLAGFQRHHVRLVERLIIMPWYMANPAADANGVSIPYKFANIKLNLGVQEKPKVDLAGFSALLTAFAAYRAHPLDDDEIRDQLREWSIRMKSDEQRAQVKVPISIKPTAKPSTASTPVEESFIIRSDKKVYEVTRKIKDADSRS